tara:strand:+ start:354 stop:485 length:132 start_codon:yes stop_codon:yes gene_type:complete
LTNIEDDFKDFIKKSRQAEAQKKRKEKEAIITKQLKELLGEEE